MLYYKCKCGKCEFWGSGMSPYACQVCDECGTTMLKNLDGTYVEPKPHEYVAKYNQNTGKPYKICKWCLEKKID